MKALVYLSDFENGSEIRGGQYVCILTVAAARFPSSLAFSLRKIVGRMTAKTQLVDRK